MTEDSLIMLLVVGAVLYLGSCLGQKRCEECTARKAHAPYVDWTRIMRSKGKE